MPFFDFFWKACINGPVRCRVIERYNLKHRPPAETFQGLYGRVFLAALRRIESLPDIALNTFGKSL